MEGDITQSKGKFNSIAAISPSNFATAAIYFTIDLLSSSSFPTNKDFSGELAFSLSTSSITVVRSSPPIIASTSKPGLRASEVEVSIWPAAPEEPRPWISFRCSLRLSLHPKLLLWWRLQRGNWSYNSVVITFLLLKAFQIIRVGKSLATEIQLPKL